jgi:hypothetical protein
MKLIWFRILPLISAVFSIFVIIAIILINLGGVDAAYNDSPYYRPAINHAFNIVKVDPSSLFFHES